MKDFVYNDDYFLLDPYAVEGEERLRRFLHNFMAQEPYGSSGALEQGSIFIEAQRYLLPEHFRHFCDCVGLSLGSSGFEILRLVGECCRQSGKRFDSHVWAAGILRLHAPDRDAILEHMLERDAFRPYLRAMRRAA
jgi:hypothetical protein